jgi:hypothetical protein
MNSQDVGIDLVCIRGRHAMRETGISSKGPVLQAALIEHCGEPRSFWISDLRLEAKGVEVILLAFAL